MFLEVALRSITRCDVFGESDGRRALARVQDVKPDLVILDQWLNDGVRGHELANVLKRQDPTLLVALWSCGFDVLSMKYVLKHSLADHIDIKTTDFEHLIASVTGEAVPAEPDWNAVPRIEDMRKEIALRTLARSGGNKSEAARLLRKDRSTLIRWLSSGTSEHDA